MIGKLVIVAVLCVSCVLAEAPINRYRYRQQRLRQLPQRQFFARQEAPYPPAASSGEPQPEYGPPPSYGPPTTEPAPQYGPPPPSNGDTELTNNETTDNPESEALPGAAGQPSRLTKFQKFTLPSKANPQKFSQRLELQQQVHLPNQPQFQQVQPQFQQVQLAPLSAPIQQEGSYFVQLPNGIIQRVNYITQPNLVDNTLAARLQFRPVAVAQTTVNEPQVYVNTLVNSYATADE